MGSRTFRININIFGNFAEILVKLPKFEYFICEYHQKIRIFAANINTTNRKHIRTMARPIKETPVLTGRDAERFVQDMYKSAPVTARYKKQMQETFLRFKQAATFEL